MVKNKIILSSFFLFLFTLSLTLINTSCQNEEETKFKKYMSLGKQLYQSRCQHCHGKNGQGLGKLYPPLNKSDYLFENLDKLSCIIKYGQAGSIQVNGVEYNQVMPGNPDLLDDEIATLITFITNAWENKSDITEKPFVEKSLSECD